MSFIAISSEKDYIDYLNAEKQLFKENYGKRIHYNIRADDFECLQLLGIGSFGKVFFVKKKKSEEFYAMKVLIKSFLVNSNQIEHTLYEKQILECLRSPFTVNLLFFCMSNSFIYFILPFIPGGEVFNLLRLEKSFTEDQARFYAAQVILGLEYLHYLDLAYRDLKPENLLIDHHGSIKIADFGFCKVVKGRTYTLCGTPDYIAPEIILNKGHGKAVDFWSLGVLIYEMCAGYPPFVAPDIVRLYERITTGKYRNTPFFTRELKDIIKRFLKVDSVKRLGNLAKGFGEIKKHDWFKDTNWLALANHRVEPPFKPQLSGPDDTHYFDPVFDKTELRNSEIDYYREHFKLF